MIFENMEFHNVAELERFDYMPGLVLRRVPKKVRDKMGLKGHEKGRVMAQTSTGCEIRFVTKSKAVKIFLSALDANGEILVYRGDIFCGKHTVESGRITTLLLEEPEMFSLVNKECLQGAFSSDVWRIFMSRGFAAVYHGIDAMGHEVRPPMLDELPKNKWFAYGSSITHGANSLSHNNAYIQQAARRLGVDVINHGFSGACQCENEMADYIASRSDWDFITLELGVNMRLRFTSEEFEVNARYIIEKMIKTHPEKKVVCISIYPNNADFQLDESSNIYIRNKEFRSILKNLCKELNNGNLYFIEGSDILTDYTGITLDLLHPADYGHIIMGENLANKLKEIIYK